MSLDAPAPIDAAGFDTCRSKVKAGRLGFSRFRRPTMDVCPIALAVGCAKCPAVSLCPVKSSLGDYKPPPMANDAKTGAKPK